MNCIVVGLMVGLPAVAAIAFPFVDLYIGNRRGKIYQGYYDRKK